jgi:hypothetical protein
VQAVEEGNEQGLVIVGRVEDLTNDEAKGADCGLALQALDGGTPASDVITHRPGGVVESGDKLCGVWRHDRIKPVGAWVAVIKLSPSAARCDAVPNCGRDLT